VRDLVASIETATNDPDAAAPNTNGADTTGDGEGEEDGDVREVGWRSLERSGRGDWALERLFALCWDIDTVSQGSLVAPPDSCIVGTGVQDAIVSDAGSGGERGVDVTVVVVGEDGGDGEVDVSILLKRRRVVQEFLETERTYVRELSALNELYIGMIGCCLLYHLNLENLI
jgi:hypothetical protein